jgi:hypothetical protein
LLGEFLPSVILGLDPRIQNKKIFFPWIPGQAGDDNGGRNPSGKPGNDRKKGFLDRVGMIDEALFLSLTYLKASTPRLISARPRLKRRKLY